MNIDLSAKTHEWLKENARLPRGTRVLVTGATGSLGRYACAALCELGANLVLPVRDTKKGEALRNALLSKYLDSEIFLESVDMTDPASVDALSKRILRRGEKIDCLVNNAGVFGSAGIRLDNGAELHEQVNARSPLRLSEALIPLLRLSETPRIVTVTSLAARFARISDADPLTIRSATAAYGRSKLALMRGIAELSKRNPDIKLVFSHPGVSATDLFHPRTHPSAYARGFMRVAMPIMRRVFMQPEKAALTTVCAVCADERNFDMAVPRGLWQVWGYPVVKRVWGVRV